MTIRMICRVLMTAVFLGLCAVTQSVAQQDGMTIYRQAEPTLACVFRQSGETADSYVVFHLAGFTDDGTLIYRSVTAPIFELTLKPDGGIESQANPCKDELISLDRGG